MARVLVAGARRAPIVPFAAAAAAAVAKQTKNSTVNCDPIAARRAPIQSIDKNQDLATKELSAQPLAASVLEMTGDVLVVSPLVRVPDEKGALKNLRTAQKSKLRLQPSESAAVANHLVLEKAVSECPSGGSKGSAGSATSYVGTLHDRLKSFAKARETVCFYNGNRSI
jgi:hypothetical protein